MWFKQYLVERSESWQQTINNLSLVLLWTKITSESLFFYLCSAPHLVPCHFHKICLIGLEISLAHCDIINILTVLCGLAQHTDKAYVGLLQVITSKILFMQICKLQIDKIVCLKDSLFMSRSTQLTGCVVGVPLGGPRLQAEGSVCSFMKHQAQMSNEWFEGNQVGPRSQQPGPVN